MKTIITDYGVYRVPSMGNFISLNKQVKDLLNSLTTESISKITALLTTIQEIEKDGTTIGDLLEEIKQIEKNFVEKQDTISTSDINTLINE